MIESSYVSSNEPGIEGKEVEFVPKYNFKTGLKFGYKNFTSYLQYSYLSDQFSDSSNSISSNLSGVIGLIPSYDILDFSANYSFEAFRIETGINNILNEKKEDFKTALDYYNRASSMVNDPEILLFIKAMVVKMKQ